MFNWLRAIPGQAQIQGKGVDSICWCRSGQQTHGGWLGSVLESACRDCGSQSLCKFLVQASPQCQSLPRFNKASFSMITWACKPCPRSSARLSPWKRGSPSPSSSGLGQPALSFQGLSQHGRKGACSQERGCGVLVQKWWPLWGQSDRGTYHFPNQSW